MEETAIITLRIKDGPEEDFEIQRNARYERWMPVVEQYLRSENIDIGEGFVICHKGIPLQENDTFNKLGIWDGSVLEVTRN